ncbi:uncharacterized protein N7484_009915 [Penicillium longicatenatum]|uniref:uncharacterized protein n=1 Tax=Penicillium longicatenatum TaxID=1561947 RepID=UPI0025468976|nr:uncharacterized protein N7484_009915 [Penicillium longicatenatum]KAJ5636602.1 hypothetical protein N7484_009915 [Penicillium longicatenatum]
MPKISSFLRWDSVTLHYVYFIVTSAIGSVIIYTSRKIPGFQYADAAFMSFSAMTGTGLTVIDLSMMNTVQQAILFILFILGHAIPILGVLSFTRSWRLGSVLKNKQNNETKAEEEAYIPTLDIPEKPLPEKQEDASDKGKTSPEVTIAVLEAPTDISSPIEPDGPYMADNCIVVTDLTQPEPVQSFVPIDENDNVLNTKRRISRMLARLTGIIQRTKEQLNLDVSIDYTDPEGIEYRARILLAALIIFYFLAFLSLGCLAVGLWLQIYSPEVSLTDGISPFWTGAFLATSALANNGMSLIDTNMIPFQREAAPLLICGTLILAGNTLFPCLLRLSIWTMRKMMPDISTWQTWRHTLDFALVQSQNVCSSLYPTWHTWFLFGSVIVLNAIMWGAFELASIRDLEIGALPAKYRVLDGLFQSLSIRGGGFSIVEFDGLPQGLLMLYGRSTTNTEKPTTISSLEESNQVHPPSQTTPTPSRLARSRFLYQQLRSQFSHDIWWISFAILLITIAESDHYKIQPVEFSTFNVIFEVISAYSCVGASIGYPGSNFAFCGQWNTFSKLLLVAVSLKGRLRGLSIANTKLTSSPCVLNKGQSFDVKSHEKDNYIESNRRLSSCV